MGELLLANFAGRGIENRDLLLPRVQVTSDECHDNGLLCVGAVALGLAERSSSAGAFLMTSVTLLADLEEFVHDHRPHGTLAADATEPAR